VETGEKFKMAFKELYASGQMEKIDLGFLKLRADRFNSSNDIFNFVMDLNDSYVREIETSQLQHFWQRLAQQPDRYAELLQEFSTQPIFNQYDSPHTVVDTLKSLDNGQLYRFSQKLLERRDDPKYQPVIEREMENTIRLADAIYQRYKNEFGIRASNMKDLANILLFSDRGQPSDNEQSEYSNRRYSA
jgi:hypothetical protein